MDASRTKRHEQYRGTWGREPAALLVGAIIWTPDEAQRYETLTGQLPAGVPREWAKPQRDQRGYSMFDYYVPGCRRDSLHGLALNLLPDNRSLLAFVRRWGRLSQVDQGLRGARPGYPVDLMRMEILRFQALCRLESLLAHQSWRAKTKLAEVCATRITYANWAADYLERELPQLPGPPWGQPSGATGWGPAEVLAPEAVDWPPWALDTLAEAARGLEPGAVPEGGALSTGIAKVGSAAWRRGELDFVEADINLELYGHALVGSVLDLRGRPVNCITADSLIAGIYLMHHLDRTAGWMLWECSSRGCPRRRVFTLSALQYALVQKGREAYCSRPCQNREMQRRHYEAKKGGTRRRASRKTKRSVSSTGRGRAAGSPPKNKAERKVSTGKVRKGD